MKKITSLLFVFLLSIGLNNAQSQDTLKIHYYENYPYAYTEDGKLKGIEVEIIEEYTTWLKQKKNKTVFVEYTAHKDFGEFYSSVKSGDKSTIGLGSVTPNTDREKEVLFSAPYLQNVAVLITAGKVPTIRSRTNAEVTKVLGVLNAVAVSKSSHVMYLNELKKQFLPTLKISLVENQNQVLERIVSDNMYFGYVDIVAYWSFLKNNPGKFLKMQKQFSEPKEMFRFIAPMGSFKLLSVDEFFESGFGFTSTKKYHQILESYLGYEIIESVEIK